MIRILIKNDFNITLLSQYALIALFSFFFPLVLFLVIFFFYYHWERKPSFKIVFLSFALLIFSLAVWDRQPPWSKMLESNQDATAFFKNILPQDATILWDASAEIPWFGAIKPSYISASQGSGVVFHQKTALEYAKRVNIILPLMDVNPMESKEISFRLSWGIDKTKFTSSYIGVCRDAKELDYIISNINVPGKSMAHWRSPVPIVRTGILDGGTFEESTEQDFYLYNCGVYKEK